MRTTMRMIVIVAIVLMNSVVFAAIKVSDVEVFSGYPWKEVVVGYTITGTDTDICFVRLTATDKSTNKSYTAKTLTGAGIDEGRHVLHWNASSEGVNFSSENVVFSVLIVSNAVQLWEGGPHWADCNIGASKPEGFGYYFWWGDTIGYKRKGSSWNAVDGSKSGFVFTNENCPTYNKDDATLKSRGYIDATGNLVAKYDAATQHLGTPWRMPTDAEWSALVIKCTTTWTTRNGVNGYLVTGRGEYASKSIFLPAAGWGYDSEIEDLGRIGWYWASTSHSTDRYYAWGIYFLELSLRRAYSGRCGGNPVRPVRGFEQ